jgi:hypothetical protein
MNAEFLIAAIAFASSINDITMTINYTTIHSQSLADGSTILPNLGGTYMAMQYNRKR